MLGNLIYILFALLPIAVIAFFVISLCLFISAKRKNKTEGGIISDKQMKERKILLVISSVLLGIMLLFGVGIIALFTMAIAFM